MPPPFLFSLLHLSAAATTTTTTSQHLSHKSPPPSPTTTTTTTTVSVLTTALLALSILILLIILYLFFSFFFRRRRHPTNPDSNPTQPFSSSFLLRHGFHALLHHHPPSFTYDQLRLATSNFSSQRKLGDGGFGSVYLATLPNGSLLAVKRLHRHIPEAASASTVTKSFCNEILILSSLRHPNLVRLHGYCADPRGLLLVYDYAPNGTLADHLHGKHRHRASLSWGVRVDIAAQIASALEYLHFGVKTPVVHRDVTSSNIFVEMDLRVRLGDFGLSRLLTLPDACSTAGTRELVCSTGPQGTPGYLDPDYHRSFRLNEKSDVYSFGVVLLELVTGLGAVDVRRERAEVALADWVVGKCMVGELRRVVDSALAVEKEEEGVVESIEAVAELAFRCVAGDKDDRPDAKEILAELRRIQGKLLHVAVGA